MLLTCIGMKYTRSVHLETRPLLWTRNTTFGTPSMLQEAIIIDKNLYQSLLLTSGGQLPFFASARAAPFS